MSKRSFRGLLVCVLMCGVLLTKAWAAEGPSDSFGARLLTYDKAAGESYYALSITPQLRPPSAPVRDVAVVVDTSASQAGLFREDSLLALETLLSRLEPRDRVKLLAVDLEAVHLTDSFVSAHGKAAAEGQKQIEDRTPLGATDMIGAVRAGLESFEATSDHPRAIIYIGDGVSRANMFGDDEIQALVRQLVAERVSVSSYAIGPERNVEFLAVLANQTGGRLYVDSDSESAAQEAGAGLARAAQLPVFWPQEVQFPGAMVEHYPVTVPPLRTDRDTIVIGKLESHQLQPLSMTAEVNGNTVELAWDLVAKRSTDDLAFLPQLVDRARDNGGLTLPTLGSEGLREVGRLIFGASEDLSSLGGFSGEIEGADKVFQYVSYQEEEAPEEAEEPEEPEDAESSEVDEPLRLSPPASSEAGEEPAAGEAAPAAGGVSEDEDLLSELDSTTQLLDEVEAGREVRAGKIQAEVQQGLSQAREKMGTDPAAAIQSLKAMHENVMRAPSLEPGLRSQLRDRIGMAIREAQRRQEELEETRRQIQENQAIADESQRLAREFTEQREKVEHLIDKFNALVDEGIGLAMAGKNVDAKENFDAAINEIANPIDNMLPGESIGVSARVNASI
ncbi:MAG: VWA domain-containing protein, partial [Planctomycetota bacterium]